MYNRKRCLSFLFSALTSFGLISCISSVNASSIAQGQPFQDLQDQIDSLQAQVDALSGAPQSISIDCTLGETITGALASVANPTAPVTITISGTCNETVAISRSNTTIQGQSGSDTINGGIVVSGSGNSLRISNLTVTGGGITIFALAGGQLSADNVTVNSTGLAVLASHTGYVEIADSTITAAATAVFANLTSQAVLRGTIVENSNIGIHVGLNSNIWIGPSAVNPGQVTVIRNNNQGSLVGMTGSLNLSGVTIENSTGNGILMQQGSSLDVISFFGGANTITGNITGILMETNTNLTSNTNLFDITNNNTGVICIDESNISLSTPINFSGNTVGDFTPNCPLP